MKTIQRLLLLFLMIGLLAWAVADSASAQRVIRDGGGASGTGLQYVIKFVCGSFFSIGVGLDSAQGLPAFFGDLPEGAYFTDINIHNPNAKQVKFRKKVALDAEEWEHHGLQTSPVDVILGADEALEINCTDIERLLLGERRGELSAGLEANSVTAQGRRRFAAEGFVVLYTREKLDVAAFYSGCGFERAKGLSVTAAGGRGPECVDPTMQMDQPITPSVAPAPTVFTKFLSVSSAGVSLSVQPFSTVGYDGAQLSIYSQNGQLLHEGSYTAGTQLSWKPMATNGKPLANGVYFYVVSVRDVLGNVGYKVGKFALVR